MLSCNNVFSRYTVSISDKFASTSYNIYKNARIFFSKWFPLKDYETHSFENEIWRNEISAKMPKGYNLISHVEEDGYINLDYIDFYDYLPKENIIDFKNSLKKIVKKNKLNTFGIYITSDRFDDIDNMGQFYDAKAFSNLSDIRLTQNKALLANCTQLSISMRNLSSSFALVKYRFYISDKFNKELNAIFKTDYESYSQISRQFNIPWYRPMRFGRSIYDGNQARTRNIYSLISSLKWEAFKEIRKTFKSYFWLDRMFPPVFETYSTNIRPSNTHDNSEFWYSAMFDRMADYSIKYNTCVCWDYECSYLEGTRLSAYCGGALSKHEHLPQIAQHEIADIYAVYLVARTIDAVARRDIALCNKKISSAMKKQYTHKLLKTRLYIEKKLYYCRRFINEFSGNTIDEDGAKFRNEHLKNDSMTSHCFKYLLIHVRETRNLVNDILRLSNDAVEYRCNKSNITIQWIMLIITLLSLIIAVVSILANAQNITVLINDWMNSLSK